MMVLHCKSCGHLKHGRKFSMAALDQNKLWFSEYFHQKTPFKLISSDLKACIVFVSCDLIDLQAGRPIGRLFLRKIPLTNKELFTK